MTHAHYLARRKRLLKTLGEGVAIVPTAPEVIRNRDAHYPYRFDSYFWYLTGCAEPEGVLVLVPGRRHGESLLFCRERDPEREGWDGPRLGPEGAVDLLGMDDAYPIADIDDILPGLLEGRRRVHYHLGRDPEFDLKLIGWLNRVRAQVRQGAQPPQEFLELGHLLDEQRYIGLARGMLNNVKPQMRSYPAGYSNWAQLMLMHVHPLYEIAITGPDALRQRAAFAGHYLPNRLFLGATGTSTLPLLEGKQLGTTTIFVCVDKQCKLPVGTVAEAFEQMR